MTTASIREYLDIKDLNRHMIQQAYYLPDIAISILWRDTPHQHMHPYSSLQEPIKIETMNHAI